MKKSKAELVRNWLEKARRDLVTAQNGLDYAETFTDIICFHAQQAGEKYLKAYLVWHEIVFPKTHSLEDLILLATQQEPSVLALHDTASQLTPYAVEIRYGESEAPSEEDAKAAIKIAQQIKDFILGKLPDEVKIPHNARQNESLEKNSNHSNSKNTVSE